MYRKQVRRRRAILVLLIVAALVLLSTRFSESDGGPLHSMQRAVASVFGPLEEGASRALKPARDLVNWFDETFQARGQNSDLHADVQQLRNKLAKAQGAQGENQQLRILKADALRDCNSEWGSGAGITASRRTWCRPARYRPTRSSRRRYRPEPWDCWGRVPPALFARSSRCR